ncbi:hypothetical protein AMR72_02265 [Flavobacterium psychrophilum]|nr:hypothetical protein AMR72_02265 [Flavobacterium psychrophilum]AOE51450.1 hypothetical protein ALW18_02265 [Flavobacterium psychrophilum]
MEKPFIEIDADNIILHPQEAHPIEGFKFSVNEETGKQFPYCCETHTTVYNRALKWFDRFPNCCEGHRKFATKPFFRKSIYNGVAERIINQCSYTMTMIENRINNEDWYEDITDYLEYNIKCFGQPAAGLHIYIDYVSANINNDKIISDISKQEKLQQYLDTYFNPEEKKQKEKTDFNVLYETYQKWLKIFPFEISFFTHLKPQFEKTIPFLRGEGKTNRYTGLTIFKPHTKRSLIDTLIELTNTIISQLNTHYLYNKGALNEPERIRLELTLSKRKLKLSKGYINKSATEEQRYRKILKEWLSDEKKFIDEITLQLKAMPVNTLQIEDSKANISNDEIINWLELFDEIKPEEPIKPNAYKTSTYEQKGNYFSEASFNLTLQYLTDFKKQTSFLSKARKLQYIDALNLAKPSISYLESPHFNQVTFNAQSNYYEFIQEYKKSLTNPEEDNNKNATCIINAEESKTLLLIKSHIEAIDNNGWQYSFQNENDYKTFTSLLTAYFEQIEYTLPVEAIRLKRGCKTRLAKAFHGILKELGNKDKLNQETEYFDIIRKLNHFEKEKDLYKAITR